MPKVSVIVPVYGVEKYISKCIESILNQTYTDWELILVDDGSPDNSGFICDEYARKDSRIRVIHKENGGVSSARNVGLDYATGEWVTFVDADDWIDLNTFNICLPYMADNDIVRFSMNLVMNVDETDIRPFLLLEEPKEQYLARIVSRETILGVCGGLYRRKLFCDNDIRFDLSLICGEDWVVLTNLVVHSNNCKILPQPLYQYNKYNESSCTTGIKYANSISTVRALNQIGHLLTIGYSTNNPFRKSLSKAKCSIIYEFVASVLLHHPSITKSEMQEYQSAISIEQNEILGANISFKEKVILLLYNNVFGKLAFNFIYSSNS